MKAQIVAVILALGGVAPAAQPNGAFSRRLRNDFPPGKLIADGSAQKQVYAVAGNANLVLRVLRPQVNSRVPSARGKGQGAWQRKWILQQEHDDLANLRRNGFPVPDVVAKGYMFGRPADVMERFPLASKDTLAAGTGVRLPAGATGQAPLWKQRPDVLNLRSRPDLLSIRRAIENGVAVHDLQLLLKPGRVVVFDPAGLVTRTREPARYQRVAAQNLRLIDEMLQYAQ